MTANGFTGGRYEEGVERRSFLYVKFSYWCPNYWIRYVDNGSRGQALKWVNQARKGDQI